MSTGPTLHARQGAPLPAAPAAVLPATLAAWLDEHAEALDTTQDLAAPLFRQLADAGQFGIGVPAALGGHGGDTVDAIHAIEAVATHSLTAAFVFWGHRTFIEYLLHSTNGALRERWLGDLLAGHLAGATGLSNAMKYLSQIEPLQMQAVPVGNGSDSGSDSQQWALSGQLPWITNLHRDGFVAAAAFDHANGSAPSIFAVPSDRPGVVRGDDLDLVALRSSHTASLRVEGAVLGDELRIADDLQRFLAYARPGFLGLQCAMSIGLARRALASLETATGGTRDALDSEAAALGAELAQLSSRLYAGVRSGHFVQEPAAMFGLRIALADTVAAAIHLETQTAGGRGYLRGQSGTLSGVARRIREAAFVPVITPSLVQLKSQLAAHARAAA